MDSPADLLKELVLEHHSREHLHRVHLLRKIAKSLHRRFTRLEIWSDLDKAITLQRNVLELLPQSHPDLADSLENIASYLHTRFARFNTLSDLDEALTFQRSALELYPEGHPDRAISLGNTAYYLHARFTQLGTLSILDEALALQRSALELRPEGHPDRAVSLGNIAGCLYSRFCRVAELPDLDEALSLERNALELRLQGDLDLSISLGNIANYLYSRFTHLGTLSDLDEALALQRSALELRPPGHPHRVSSLGNIGNYLYSRFTHLGTLSDLNEALVFHRDVLELRPKGHPERTVSMSNIAICLHRRFIQLGTLSDLDEALALERSLLELRPQGHPDRSASMGNIASYLHTRFIQLGTLSDLEEALDLQRRTLELFPEGDPDRAVPLGNIANILFSRFERLRELPDLDEALALQRSVLDFRPQGHPIRPIALGNTATYLHVRFKQLGTPSDLDEALTLHRNSLELFPQGHPQHSTSLGNIANCLRSRFTQFGILSDLDEAFELERCALELRPRGHPLRASSLAGLARCLLARFKHSPVRDKSDLQEMFDLYSQLCDVPQSVSSFDIKCAKQWIEAAEEYEHGTTLLAYQTFLHLSVQHLATLPSLPQHLSLLKQLMVSLPADAFSAGVRCGNLINATELIEQGRGLFWSQLARIRSPLDEVMVCGDTGKELANKFMQLALELRSVLNATSNTESQHNRAWSLNVQLQDTLTNIRKLPGLSRFLQPPLFSNLRVAAVGGPVIIVNASQYTCDALVLLSDQDPIHVELPTTKTDVSRLSRKFGELIHQAKSDNVTREIYRFLRKLWDTVVSPIVKVLQDSCPLQSRIWWCPTAEFSLLPLHAAGLFSGQPRMLSDLYVSSYTPTLTALVRSRQNLPLGSSTKQHRFLLVGQAQAPKQKALASVNTELSAVSQRLGSAAMVTCIQDQDANIARVSEELTKNNFIHLACHGIPDRKHPFESGFALGDGLLKVEHIMGYDLQNAQFAYLSACHTTVGDEESPDEVIHLAAAMQFAGFRSVIGTTWAVDDAHTNKITSKFYDNMMDESGRLDHTQAAVALHKTMRSFRSSEVPLDQQILYVHIGA